MTRDDVIRMARECGVESLNPMGFFMNQRRVAFFECFATMVAAAEREECIDWIKAFSIVGDRSEEMIAAIRAMGEK